MTLAPLQIDALREVVNIGCGSAVTALSRLVGGRRVSIEVPGVRQARPTTLGYLGSGEAWVVASAVDVEGEIEGQMLLLMQGADARALAELLLGAPQVEGALNEAGRSALCEVANIFASAFLSSLARLAGLKLLPSVPRYGEGAAGELPDGVLGPLGPNGDALVVETRFSSPGSGAFGGQILLFPDLASLPRLFQALGL